MSTPPSKRGKALWPLGWTGALADWIAFASLNGGLFTRRQIAAYLRVGRAQAHRRVREMTEGKIALEETVEGRRICRITKPRIYKALGLSPTRGRPVLRRHAAMRRLLTLDYMIDHRRLPWLPTATEKVEAFEALGIARDILPSRRHGVPDLGARTAYFQHEYPIALDDDRARFTFVDPGFSSGESLRRWGRMHRPLWDALRERGRAIEVVAAVRSVRELQRARGTLEHWSRPLRTRASADGRPAREEIERIEGAVLRWDDALIREYGGIRNALRRLADLRRGEGSARTRPTIDVFDTWRSTRLPGTWL
ncbi:MAG: hypothetical protein OXT72_10640 [Gammaproteobacteria bacterium]|nr:hypothetical protein [Gammaproteobacteria bacterium]MDE0248922.1 hypothetical protein [Gammaproteobacteria bacterium]